MTHQENAPRAAACQCVGPEFDASTDCQDGQGSMITVATSLTVSSLSIQTICFRIWTWRLSLRRFGRDRTAAWTHRHRCRGPWRPAAIVLGRGPAGTLQSNHAESDASVLPIRRPDLNSTLLPPVGRSVRPACAAPVKVKRSLDAGPARRGPARVRSRTRRRSRSRAASRTRWRARRGAGTHRSRTARGSGRRPRAPSRGR
jgi:hypothetical protein